MHIYLEHVQEVTCIGYNLIEFQIMWPFPYLGMLLYKLYLNCFGMKWIIAFCLQVI